MQVWALMICEDCEYCGENTAVVGVTNSPARATWWDTLPSEDGVHYWAEEFTLNDG